MTISDEKARVETIVRADAPKTGESPSDPGRASGGVRRYLLGGRWAKSIFAGLLATAIFVYFLDPILSFLGRTLISTSSEVYKNYLDRLYAEIAAGVPSYSYLVWHTMIWIFASFFAMTFGMVLLATKKRDKKREKQRTEDDSTMYPRRLRRPAFLGLIGATIMLLALLLSATRGYVRLQTTSTFNQHITILGPHITDLERRELLAQFASMKSKEDFDRLAKRMHDLASQFSLELPKNRLYP